MDLLIRAARNDHGMIEKLCAPASAGLWATRRLRLSGLVADATVTAERAQLRKVATAAGIPYLIDPVTPLLQDDQAPDHAWARLPFATAERHTAAELNHPDLQDELIERTLDYQREHGATVLIPPYLYSPKRGDAWFEVNLQMLKRSARYLEREGIGLPVAPVFAVSLLEYGPRSAGAEGIDRYLAVAATMNLRYVALSWSASAPGKEGYAKLAHLLTATRHAAIAQPVIGWRQGLYGLALAAAGAAGYETGAGQTERCHYPAFTAARRPQPPRRRTTRPAPAATPTSTSTFGRSLPRRVGAALLSDPPMRGSLVCTDEATCCTDGATSMIDDWREHAVRARSRELQQLEQMPPSLTWRLNSIARGAERSLADARLGNAALREAGIAQRLPEDTFRGLVRVAEGLRAQSAEQADDQAAAAEVSELHAVTLCRPLSRRVQTFAPGRTRGGGRRSRRIWVERSSV
jgi:hypothetical protein